LKIDELFKILVVACDNLNGIDVTPRRERQISLVQFQNFLAHLPEFYQKLCTAQFLGACRVGEIAGLQWKNVNFETRTIRIQDVLTWTNGKARVKHCPKNSKTRYFYMSDAMFAILQERLAKRDGCDFVFHKNGKPLLYSVINANCNRAWKKAGLNQFHGTHQARFASAQQARILTRSIDGVKSLTGQSIQMAQKYSDYSCIDQNKATIEKMEMALISKTAS
jgi:integrase